MDSNRFGITPMERTSPFLSATATAIVSACTSKPTKRILDMRPTPFVCGSAPRDSPLRSVIRAYCDSVVGSSIVTNPHGTQQYEREWWRSLITPLPIQPPVGFMDFFPFLLLGALRCRVRFKCVVAGLALQLRITCPPIRRNHSSLYSLSHGASRLVFVPAIAK